MDSTKYIGDISKIKDHYEKQKNVSDKDPKKDTYLKRMRGYELEKLIYSLFFNEKLNPKTSYAPEGEQIDGAFKHTNDFFLVEAKWHTKPTEASKIYSFKGKVDGKFHHTSGIFISMSGYSDDAPLALRMGKTANIILFDGDDMEDIFLGKITFVGMLNYKIEIASFIGELYSPYRIKDKAIQSEETLKEVNITSGKTVTDTNAINEKMFLIVSVDQKLFDPFLKNTLSKLKLPNDLKFLQMTLIGTHPELSYTVKNIHRTILSLKDLDKYLGVIILYPTNDPIYSYDPEDPLFLNDILVTGGLKQGASILMTDTSGDFNENITRAIEDYIIRSVNPNALFNANTNSTYPKG